MDNPRLTIGLICGPHRDRGSWALGSLLRQTAINDLRIIVADCASPDSAEIEGCDHPVVQVIKRPSSYNLGAIRAEIVDMAKTPLVGFLEEHAIAFPKFAAGLIATHEQDWAAVAPEVRPFPQEPLKSRILNRWYDAWIAPVARQATDHLMGHNVCYKKEVLHQYSHELSTWLGCEYLFHQRLYADGFRLTMDPTAGIHHALERDTSALARGVMNYERLHASARTDTSSKRWRTLIATALGPLIKPARILVQTVRDRPGETWPALAGIPHLTLIASGSSLGRLRGWLFGAGNAATELGQIEISVPRLWQPTHPREVE